MDNQNSMPSQEPGKEPGLLGKIKKSIYGPDYYQEVLKKDARYSWAYFFKFSLIVAAISTLIISFLVLPSLSAFFKRTIAAVVEKYPNELEVRIEKGTASTNVEEPFAIAFVQDAMSATQGDFPWRNAIIIDTKHDFSLSEFKENDTLLWLSKDSLVYQDSNGKISIQSLAQIDSLLITKDTVEQFISKAQPYVKLLIPLMGIFIFMGAWFYFFVFYAVYLLLGALIIWGVLMIKNVQVSYVKSYQIGLHLMTLPIILSLVPQMDWVLFSIVLAVITLINFSGLEKIKTPKKQHEDAVNAVQGGTPVAASKIDA